MTAQISLHKQAPGEWGPKQAPKTFWGSWMPFAGVRYYALLDEEDIAEGRNKLRAIGWRAARVWSGDEEYLPSPANSGIITSSGPGLAQHSLREADIFAQLSDEQVGSVAALGELLKVPAGQALGAAGQPGDLLFVILEGQAELSTPSAIGEITVRVAGPGESFPLAALIGGGTLITSAKAMSDMRVVAIPRTALLKLCSKEPELGMRVFAAAAGVLAERYRKTLAHLTVTTERALKKSDFFAEA